MVNRNSYIVTSRIVLGLFLMLSFGCSKQKHQDTVSYPKKMLEAVRVTEDSTLVSNFFFPERWFLCQEKIYILNNRDSLFLSIYDLKLGKILTQWGIKGNGPGEYVLPSLGEMKKSGKVALYSNARNQIDIYNLVKDSLLLTSTGKFPIWDKKYGMPKAYTRLQQYNDSIFVGTSFMPREIAVEMVDIKNQRVIDVVDFPLKSSEMSGPFECKVSVSENRMAIAYRYINRIEVYHVSEKGFSPNYVIGESETQEDLYKQDRDDEMIKHYSDIYCGKNKIYALYQGVQEKNLLDAHSYLEVFDIDKGTNIAHVDLGKYVTDILIDENLNKVYAYAPENGDYLFEYFIP